MTLSKAESKLAGGGGRFGVAVTVGFTNVDATEAMALGKLSNGFDATVVVVRLFAVADVKFPFAWARICATSGETSPNENDERLGVAVLFVVVVVAVVVAVVVGLFNDTKGILVVVVLLLFTDVTVLDKDDDVSYIHTYIDRFNPYAFIFKNKKQNQYSNN